MMSHGIGTGLHSTTKRCPENLWILAVYNPTSEAPVMESEHQAVRDAARIGERGEGAGTECVGAARESSSRLQRERPASSRQSAPCPRRFLFFRVMKILSIKSELKIVTSCHHRDMRRHHMHGYVKRRKVRCVKRAHLRPVAEHPRPHVGHLC